MTAPFPQIPVVYPLPQGGKAKVLEALLTPLLPEIQGVDAEALLAKILDREARKSTSIGHQAAVPHLRSSHIQRPLCSLGIVPKGRDPVEFQNPGEESASVRLVFLLLSPKGDPASHLRSLAAIARLVKDEAGRKLLLEAEGPEAAQVGLRARGLLPG